MDAYAEEKMNRFTASFYTHFAAQYSFKKLSGSGLEARMCPVPRALSSSCGTCVRFAAETLDMALLHSDTEAVYLENGDGEYTAIWKNED